MADPYETLGVRRGDSEDTIRKAYRKLAKRFHPDLNPGKPEAAERFKTINAANDLLSDPDKRGRFDRGEIDAEGHETAPAPRAGSWQQYAGAEPYAGGGAGGFGADDLDTLFGQAFGGAGRGRDMHYSVSVTFLEAANGTVRRVLLPDGRELDVTIPAGLRDGHVLRLKGQGRRGGNGKTGDALVEVSVAPHRFFRREGDDVVMDLPISVQEAVLGASVEVPTVKGKVRLAIPPGSGTGTRLRLKGRGIAGGNQYVVLTPVLPPGEDPALAALLRDWKPSKPFNPRAGLEEP
jgi:DnaJ-class molecular chaperone